VPKKKLGQQEAMLAYEKRFNQPVPGNALREHNNEQLAEKISASMKSGKPVPEWQGGTPTDVVD
jgi:hypothetical protein